MNNGRSGATDNTVTSPLKRMWDQLGVFSFFKVMVQLIGLFRGFIAMDEGAKRIGEFGVGTNFGISRYCYDLLFDEKIGGTVHIALGRAYPECGGVNQSAFHWDLIKDLRVEGALFLDDRKLIENGKFLLD